MGRETDRKSSVQLGERGRAVAFVKRRERHAMGAKCGVERERGKERRDEEDGTTIPRPPFLSFLFPCIDRYYVPARPAATRRQARRNSKSRRAQPRKRDAQGAPGGC